MCQTCGMKLLLERLLVSCRIKTCLFILAGIVTVQYLVNFKIYFQIVLAKLSECPVIPPGLQGRLTVNTQIPAWAHIEEDNPNVTSGGRYKPPDCIARHRVAIVIPYRDRELHLKLFLQNLHPFLQSQQLEYGIYVVEQDNGEQFNRALLMNVGFAEAMEQYEYDCFIFHDVDLLPEDDRNLYTCPSMSRHMSAAIDKFEYKVPYPEIFGGVMAISKHHFRLVNGFSNLYFGWGGEDDDMYRRVIYSNLSVTRYSNRVARYKMLVHENAVKNPDRYKFFENVKKRRGSDGISSLKYTLIKLEKKPLYTWILVSVNMSAVLNDEPIHKLAMRPGQLPPGKNTQQQQQQQQQHQQQKPLSQQVKPPFLNKVEEELAKAIKETVALEKFERDWDAFRNKYDTPKVVSWVPPDFTGTLPDHLTKFETDNNLKIGGNTDISQVQRIRQMMQKYQQLQKQRVNNRRQKLQARMKRPYNNIPVQSTNTQYVQVPSSNGVIVQYEGVN